MARRRQYSSCSISGEGRESVQIGLVSVMPQAWWITTPWRSWKSRSSFTGAAEPPQMQFTSEDRSGWCSSA